MLQRVEIYNTPDFKEYLAENTNIDILTIEELFRFTKNPFDVAEKIIEVHHFQREKLGEIWANYLGFAYVEIDEALTDKSYLNAIPADLLREYSAIPLYKFGPTVTVVTSQPTNPYLQDKLEKILDSVVSFVFAFPFEIEDYLYRKGF